MCQFIESICCMEGMAQNLLWHQMRVNRTFGQYFNKSPFQIEQVISELKLPKVKSKCRIIYDAEISSIKIESYQFREIKSLKLIESNAIDYGFKFHDRSALDLIYESRDSADDIIIVKNGYITDSYFANIALYDGQKWFTPANPLLKGTKREKYIHEGVLIEKEILAKDVNNYEKISLINAMLDLSETAIEISETTVG